MISDEGSRGKLTFRLIVYVDGSSKKKVNRHLVILDAGYRKGNEN